MEDEASLQSFLQATVIGEDIQATPN